MAYRGVVTLGGLALLAVATLTGCSGTSSSPSADATTTTATVADTSTAQKSASPITVQNSGAAGRAYVSVRRGILAWGCDGAPHAVEHPDKVQVQLPTSTTRHDIQLPTPGGEKLTNPKCVTMGTGVDIGVVIADIVHKKSSGLNPESYELTLFSYDLKSPSPLATVVVVSDSQKMTLTGIAGSADGVAVSYSLANNGYKPELQYFAGARLTPGWKAQGNVVGATEDLVAAEIPSRDSTSQFLVLKTTDGQAVDTGLNNRLGAIVRAASFLGSSDEGFAFAWHGVSSSDSRKLIDGVVWIDGGDISKQQNALDEATDFQPDPLSNLALVTYNDHGNQAYRVLDRTTWETKFEIDAAKAKGINLENVGISGGKLYILNRNDAPVIDITTGQSVHSGWKAFPIARRGDETIVAVESDHGGNAGCLDPAFGRGGDIGLGVYNCLSFTIVPDVDGKFPGPGY
jgi:hypothetical protein